MVKYNESAKNLSFFKNKAQENIEGPSMKHIFVFVVYKSKILPHQL